MSLTDNQKQYLTTVIDKKIKVATNPEAIKVLKELKWDILKNRTPKS